MRDKQDSARIRVDTILKPFDGRNVQVVSGFVQQQQIGVLHQGSRQRNSPAPPAGQLVHILVGGQTEVAHRCIHSLLDVPAIVCVDFRV